GWPLFDKLILPRYADAPAYLRALATSRRDRTGSVASIEAFIREHPDDPWPYLALAAIKPGPAGETIDRVRSLCPETLDSEVWERIVSAGSDDLKRRTAERLRKQIAGEGAAASLAAWPVLWQ